MLAFDIEIDRKKYVTAGVEDWSLLSLPVTASRHEEHSPVRDGYIECSIGGLTLPDGESTRHHFRWVVAPLNVGSVLTVRVVDVLEADKPKKRYRSDSVTQENPFTDEEMREMRYQDYLALKAEFEPASRG